MGKKHLLLVQARKTLVTLHYFSQCLENVVTFYVEGLIDLARLYKLGFVNVFKELLETRPWSFVVSLQSRVAW